MTLNPTLLQGLYLEDILDQPRAIQETITSLTHAQKLNDFIKSLAPESYQRIVLTGMGGSFHILNPLYLRLAELGFPVVMVETSELIYFLPRLLNDQTLLIVVSQSGRSAEIVRLLDRDGQRPTILGVTNDITSPLALKSDFVALIQAGPEASVSCKTTTASLTALNWIGDSISGRDVASAKAHLEPTTTAVEQYLAHLHPHVETLLEQLRGVHHLFVTGRGSSLAASGIGGMIMKEAAHFHSEGLGSAAFRHGPFEMLGKDCYVLVFAGDAKVETLHRKLVEDVRATGGRAALVAADAELNVFRLPAISRHIRPILEMLPLQMASLALAALAGREPGKFERIGKITASE